MKMSNVGKCSRVGFLGTALKFRKKTRIGISSQSCSDGKGMYKKVWCTCRVVVLLQSKPITFLTFSLPSPLLEFFSPDDWQLTMMSNWPNDRLWSASHYFLKFVVANLVPRAVRNVRVVWALHCYKPLDLVWTLFPSTFITMIPV